MRNLLLVLIFLPLLATADGIEWQSLDAVQSAAEVFVRNRTANIDGDVSVSSVAPDKRVKVPACDRLETSLPSGNRLWGRTSVKVSCSSPRWALYVPVTVRVTGKALVATRSIGSGQVIAGQDVEVQVLDLTPYPIGVFTRPEQAIGKTTATNIAAGNPFRAEVLRAQLAVKQGQQVVVVAKGGNFKVSSEGVAMNNAAVGQIVGVKTTSGQMVKGIATDTGMVEINF
ncbi:MAG TPA: flagellar basal body P-ring formation chaperone FlgA [Methylophilaceae bacterium]|jgi:flagella basal body P-ring formation protein FlgA